MRTARGAPRSTASEADSTGSSNSELTVSPVRSRGALRSSLVARCDAHAPVRSRLRTLPAGHDASRPFGTREDLVQQRSIGNDTVGRVSVGAIGLGAMPLSTKEDRPPREVAIATVHAALDAGVTLIDTADAYARDEGEFGHNESLVAEALASYGRGSGDVLVATKGGHTRRGSDWELDGSPAYLRRACEGSLKRLGVEAIGLYQFHRPDPATPWEESMGALRSLFDDGLVRMVGISNAN